MGTSAKSARDEWLLPTLEGLLPPEQFQQLKASLVDSYWEAAVRKNMLTDERILTALAKRFRMKVANT